MKIYVSIIVFVLFPLLISCEDKEVPKPEVINEEELITTVKLVMVDQSNSTIVREAVFFEDPFGEPGNNITIDTIRLDQNKEYLVTVYLMDQSKNPVDTISSEVKEEADEHQLFYLFKDMDGANADNLTIDYLPGDVDSHNVPLGLTPKFSSTTTLKGKLTLILKHQAGVKPTSGLGDINQGETDVEVVFPVKIQ
jgi:hypothetical protein